MVHDRVLTVPNLITLSRIIALPVALYLVSKQVLPTALAILWTIAAMDVADGYLARRLNQVSRLGSMLDPVVDRIATLATAVFLMVGGYLPTWLAALVIMRDLVVSAVALYGVCSRVRVRVTRVGKLGSLFLLFGIPGHLFAGIAGPGVPLGLFFARLLVLIGVPLAFWSALQYLSQLRSAGRTQRASGQGLGSRVLDK